MSTTARCSKCGAPVSDEVAGGFCTACLLEEGLAPADLQETPITLRYFGDYELIEEIARGGMGVVFKARQRSLNRIVAVKMILSGHLASEAEAERFRAEARVAAGLQHPGIVAIHEVGEHEGLLFFSMDYVAGQNLAQLVRDGPLPATRAAQCVREIATAIHYAHEHGVLHRDLKPSNVLIDASGKPHVTDFGLAKQLNDSQLSTADPQLTVSGQVLGSPNFMPPEQAAGKHRELTQASDVYSLGALLYHLLTGRPPFLAENIPATLRLVSETEPVSPRLLAPSVPRDLETICLKCLEKDPQRRYGTANELDEELRRFLNHEPIKARPIGAAGRLWRWSKRNPGLARTGAAASVLFLAVTIGGPIALIQINHARREAEARQKQAALEAAKSQQVAKFLQNMLAGIDPNVARGRDTTLLRELLDKAAERISHDLLDQPEVRAHLQNTIGHVYQGISEITKAEMMHRDALAARRKLLGDKHPDVSESLFWLARDLWMQGKVAEAEGPAREALTLRLEFFGKDHLLVADSLSMLGLVLQYQNKPAEAEDLFRESLKIQRALVGNEHLDVARSLVYLSFALADQKKQTEAERLNREALGILRRLPGAMPPFMARVLYGMGSAAFDQGNYPEAEALFREVLVLRKKYYGEEHLETATTLSSLGSALNRQRKFAEAETAYRECLNIRERKFPDAWYTFSTRSLLGETLLNQKKYTEAEPLLLSGYEGMKQREENIRGRNQALNSALQRLIQLYEATGQSDKLRIWKRTLAEFK